MRYPKKLTTTALAGVFALGLLIGDAAADPYGIYRDGHQNWQNGVRTQRGQVTYDQLRRPYYNNITRYYNRRYNDNRYYNRRYNRDYEDRYYDRYYSDDYYRYDREPDIELGPLDINL